MSDSTVVQRLTRARRLSIITALLLTASLLIPPWPSASDWIGAAVGLVAWITVFMLHRALRSAIRAAAG